MDLYDPPAQPHSKTDPTTNIMEQIIIEKK